MRNETIIPILSSLLINLCRFQDSYRPISYEDQLKVVHMCLGLVLLPTKAGRPNPEISLELHMKLYQNYHLRFRPHAIPDLHAFQMPKIPSMS